MNTKLNFNLLIQQIARRKVPNHFEYSPNVHNKTNDGKQNHSDQNVAR